ncbi:replication protein A 70 kDa DNA-binding subunit B-like [Senna tora]|uniref:Replication protein A 70 kDa DNA-binding subunit B-like n=1 Tax=Senna tora TaxID=362788 RepID=A0A834WTZ4_9FABA|nr:replication protein A 70 kDa DNA-binding subunit B-like [Senna tora]
MSQFNVVSASTSFHPTRHAFKLNFMFQTRVALVDDDGSIHHFGFSFVEAQRIISGELDPNILVDVIGRVLTCPKFISLHPMTRTTSVLLLTLKTLRSQGPVVIVWQFSKIKDYAGTRSLSNSMYATRILINSEVEEITQFHEGLLPEDRNTPFNPVVGRALQTTSPIEAAFSGWAHSPVDLLQHSDESRIAKLTVFDRDAFNYLGITATDLGAELVKLDSFAGKKFIFKVGIKVSEWNVFTSLTIQKMTDDPTILDKYYVHRHPQIGLTSIMDDLTRPDMNKSKQQLRGDGRRLSFHDVEASPSKETPITCKRSATDFSDDGQSSGEFMLNIDVAHKKVKIEKN